MGMVGVEVVDAGLTTLIRVLDRELVVTLRGFMWLLPVIILGSLLLRMTVYGLFR